MTTTILLADDHRLVREGLRRVLQARTDLRVVAEADDGEAAVQAAREFQPDLALVDLTMPRLGGAQAIRRIRDDVGTRCIAVSMHELIGQVKEAFKAGANGYVVKSAASSELLAAIDAVRAGRTYVSPTVAHWAIDAIATAGAQRSLAQRDVTAREREVLQLVADGLSTKEIAAALGVSVKTIETHRSSLMTKLAIRKASGLVRVAIQEGLLAYPAASGPGAR
jgi:DNA-binding NarL/FixJ family response regulator